MIRREVTVQSAGGLHLRPAATVVERASSFRSTLWLEHSGKRAQAKSMLGIMGLQIRAGSVVQIIADGEDELLAVTELANLLEQAE